MNSVTATYFYFNKNIKEKFYIIQKIEIRVEKQTTMMTMMMILMLLMIILYTHHEYNMIYYRIKGLTLRRRG